MNWQSCPVSGGGFTAQSTTHTIQQPLLMRRWPGSWHHTPQAWLTNAMAHPLTLNVWSSTYISALLYFFVLYLWYNYLLLAPDLNWTMQGFSSLGLYWCTYVVNLPFISGHLKHNFNDFKIIILLFKIISRYVVDFLPSGKGEMN